MVSAAASRSRLVDARELALILERVRHGDERAVGAATDGREESGGARPLGGGQALDPRLDLFLRRASGIEVRLRRLRRHAGDERLVVIEPRPRPLVDQEVVQPRPSERRVVAAPGPAAASRCRPTPGAGTARRRPWPLRPAWPAPDVRWRAASRRQR